MIPISRPLQKKSWAEKIADNHKFFKDNINWGISTSIWSNVSIDSNRTSVMLRLYEIYNSKFPASWFKHVLDPFSSKKEEHKQWAGKIRPANIIRPNIDFLRGEYEKRPSECHVEVRGETGYNSFLEARRQKLFKVVSQHFINEVNNQLGTTGQEDPQQQVSTGVDSKPAPQPEDAAAEQAADYKDILAQQAQADLDLIMEEQSVHEKLSRCMKDNLIAGEYYSWKGVYHDKVHYDRVSPLELDYDKAPHIEYIEDGSWACRRMYMTVPDVVDRYYEGLSPSDIDELETMSALTSPSIFYNYLQNDKTYQYNKIPVYHFQWKGFQKIGHLTGVDPTTGEPYEDIVNDSYVVNPELGETVEWQWVIQILEGTRIGDKLFTEMGCPAYQPNMIADFSKHKLSYNGKRFSDTHAENVSVAKLSLPFQIMYVILFFILEKTIAKSKGKIILVDKNTIPYTKGWDEEKFFYYSEAQGYMVIDRNQTGVDKSFQGFQVMDASQFEHIKELINTMTFCKTENDEQFGISRQSKAKMAASDSGEQAEAAIYQTSVMTEMIFADFDTFVKREKQGLIDCSQIANRNGKNATYNRDDVGMSLLEINPDYYCYAELGVVVVNNARENAVLNRVRKYTQAFAQKADMNAADVVEIETANNVAKLKGMLKKIQQQQQELQAQQAQSAHEQEIEKIQLDQQFKEYENLLNTEFMNQEYTRKEELVILQGDINIAVQEIAKGMNPDDTGGADITEIMARQNERDQMYQQHQQHSTTEENKARAEKAKIMMEEKKNATKNREIQSKERIAKAKNDTDKAVARMKPRPASSVKR